MSSQCSCVIASELKGEDKGGTSAIVERVAVVEARENQTACKSRSHVNRKELTNMSDCPDKNGCSILLWRRQISNFTEIFISQNKTIDTITRLYYNNVICQLTL